MFVSMSITALEGASPCCEVDAKVFLISGVIKWWYCFLIRLLILSTSSSER